MNIAFLLGPLIAAVSLTGCYTGHQPVVPDPSFERFRAEVYPLLLRDFT